MASSRSRTVIHPTRLPRLRDIVTMARLLALVILISALAVLVKVIAKGPGSPPQDAREPSEVRGGKSVAGVDSQVDSTLAEILAKHSDPDDRALIERAWETYGYNASRIAETDGLRGLQLLEALDLEAIYLYEQHPEQFAELREVVGDRAAADILLHWRSYFGLKRGEPRDRQILIDQIDRLNRAERNLASQYPELLPLILAEGPGLVELKRSYRDRPEAFAELAALLQLIDLSEGGEDLREAIATFKAHDRLALEAFRRYGLAGFASVRLYGPILDDLEGSREPSLDDAILMLLANADDLDALRRVRRDATLAADLRHLAAEDLIETAANGPGSLRLSIAYGKLGDRALREAGPGAATVIYDQIDSDQPLLRKRAVEALADHGATALAILHKYLIDETFTEILIRDGSAIIPPIAEVDPLPEAFRALQQVEDRDWADWVALGALYVSGDNGQSVIQTIHDDGLDRVSYLQKSDVSAVEFLPLYDVLHLANVVRSGYAPSSGEVVWALIDGGFVALDALSIATVQPQGVVASEVARSQVKTAAKGGARALGRKASETVAEEGIEAVAQRGSKWLAVRAAGGPFRALKQMPQAMPQLTLEQLATTGRLWCRKAGLAISRLGPRRFWVQGREVVSKLPVDRLWKYAAVQGSVVGAGTLAVHKMEEHLQGQRSADPSASGIR